MESISVMVPCFSPPLSQSRTAHCLFVLPLSPKRSNRGVRKSFPLLKFQCGSSSGPGPGESDSKAILDAFFLGKALAEAINERIGSTVGEFLSVIGQWQAEQQKQAQDFQEEVLERARKAKESAAREAMEEQGNVPKSLVTSTDNANAVANSASSDSTNQVNTENVVASSYPTDQPPPQDERIED